MAMRFVGSALIILLVSSACGESTPATLRPSPSASAVSGARTSPTAHPQNSPQPTTATATASLPLVAVGFSCRLPIFRADFGSANPAPEVGFISFPAGTVNFAPGPQNHYSQQQVSWPYIPSRGFYFDRAFSRWVPVPRGAVSPDGKHYAYMLAGERAMHVVDVATGSDQAFPAVPAGSTPERYIALNYASEGLYLGLGYEGSVRDLWLMDPTTGAIRKVADLDDIRAIDGSAVWTGSFNPADPNPAPGGLRKSANSVDRFDLVTSARTTWLYMPGTALGVVGLDQAGHPILESSHGSDDLEVQLLTGSGTAQLIFGGPRRQLENLGGTMSFGGPIADNHGVWFGSSTGIYLYAPTVGLQKVSNQAAYPGNGCI